MTGNGAGLSERADARSKIDIEISRDNISAGNLIFAITNESRFLIHEIILIPLPRSDGPISGAASTIADDDAGPELLGESALEPGQSLSVGVHLRPGEYALFVNSLGFSTEIIWTSLTVTA